MKFDSFLENLYFGRLKAVPDYSESSPDDPEVRSIISKFEELSKTFTPGELESQGQVPRDLLRKLGEIGFFGLTIPGEYGGVGLNLRQYLAVIREIVRLGHGCGDRLAGASFHRDEGHTAFRKR